MSEESRDFDELQAIVDVILYYAGKPKHTPVTALGDINCLIRYIKYLRGECGRLETERLELEERL